MAVGQCQYSGAGRACSGTGAERPPQGRRGGAPGTSVCRLLPAGSRPAASFAAWLLGAGCTRRGSGSVAGLECSRLDSVVEADSVGARGAHVAVHRGRDGRRAVAVRVRGMARQRHRHRHSPALSLHRQTAKDGGQLLLCAVACREAAGGSGGAATGVRSGGSSRRFEGAPLRGEHGVCRAPMAYRLQQQADRSKKPAGSPAASNPNTTHWAGMC